MATSGRYEFRNKGIDLFIDALGELNRNKDCSGKAVAFLLIPANHYGPRKDLLQALEEDASLDIQVKSILHTICITKSTIRS